VQWLIDFTPGIEAPADLDGPVLWFGFHQQKLLVDGATGQLPRRHSAPELAASVLRSQYLGQFADGTHCFSAELDANQPLPDQYRSLNLRHAYGQLDDAHFGVAARAIQIMNWEREHLFCGHCGTPTQRKPGERARVCPSCGQLAYPRLVPAIMVLVRKGDQLLLARGPHFPPGMFSALAGFVEPGETLEQTVHREVLEEVGITVKNLRYFASQSWPFPHSMMIAFFADYDSGELTPDGVEIEAAGFYSLDALPTLPGPISIAHHLIRAGVSELAAEAAQA
jgi:NAD+ diphosphatase